MNYTQARTNLITHFHTYWSAAHPTITVVHENRPFVNIDTVGNMFLAVSIEFPEAKQASIGDVPITRVNGEMYICIYTKEGIGVVTALGYIDELTTLFKHQNLSGLQTTTPVIENEECVKGWKKYHLVIPFWFHILV